MNPLRSDQSERAPTSHTSMLLTALKLQLAALVTVGGVNTDDLKNKDVVTAITEFSAAQKKAAESPGTDVNEAVTKAVKAIGELADKGDADANYTLALWSRVGMFGQGVSDAAILGMYEKAAAGNINGKAELGAIYLQKFAQDAEKVKAGVKMLQEAEAANNAGARRLVAQLTMTGLEASGIKQDVDAGIAMLKKGSDGGDGQATYALSRVYRGLSTQNQADGTTKELVKGDVKKVVEFMKKAVEQKLPEAMTEWATLLFQGNEEAGIKKDPAGAVKMLEDAAKSGSAPAYRQLGTIYEQGLLGEDKKSIDKAAENYMTAARGNDGAAQYWVANALQSGLVKDEAAKRIQAEQKANKKPEIKEGDVLIPQNPSQALNYYRLAAQNGVAQSLYNVGLYYENGAVVDKDLAKAFQLVQRAATSGMPVAQYRLGAYYQQGAGVAQDVVAGAAWIERAAKAGLPQAQLDWGRMLETGTGVDANAIAAATVYEKAADAGLPQAMVNLAQMYERGNGVQKDIARAWVMASLAVDASNNDPKAVEYRDTLSKSLGADADKAKKSYEDAKAKRAEAAKGATAPAAPAAGSDSKGKGK
jgi:uncharacterized protein